MSKDELTYLPMDKPIVLHNATCIYCRRSFEVGEKRSREHVIARNFVPRGTLQAHWNLIGNSCNKCNHDKSILEDDISAITMQPDIAGRYVSPDPRLRAEAMRKGQGSISQRTKKSVKNSQEHMSFDSVLMPGVSMHFDFHASPQLDEMHAFRLAHYHITAFFYWITYNKEKRIGHYWPGRFAPICVVHKLDWGNALMRGFQDLIHDWDFRVHASGEGEFFKIVIRRSPKESPLWAWALEWNCNHRVIGLIGEDAVVRPIFNALPKLEVHVIRTGTDSYLTSRIEQPLPESDDRLFLLE